MKSFSKVIDCVGCKAKLEISIPNTTQNWQITCPLCASIFTHSNLAVPEIDADDSEKIETALRTIKNYTPRIGIFGDSGVGKSSLCNALFGRPIAKISNVLACTRNFQEIPISAKNGSGMVLVDVPGIGENIARHKEYMELYKNMAPDLDLILWAIKADDRKYQSSLEVYKEILSIKDCCDIIFVITQSDKMEPVDEWYENKKTKLGKEQESNIKEKIIDISKTFNVRPDYIVPVSASGRLNLVALINKIVEVLPNQKKFSITREAKPENVSKEAYKNAEQGIVDYIKGILGVVVEKVGDILIEKVLSKIRSWFPW